MQNEIWNKIVWNKLQSYTLPWHVVVYRLESFPLGYNAILLTIAFCSWLWFPKAKKLLQSTIFINCKWSSASKLWRFFKTAFLSLQYKYAHILQYMNTDYFLSLNHFYMRKYMFFFILHICIIYINLALLFEKQRILRWYINLGWYYREYPIEEGILVASEIRRDDSKIKLLLNHIFKWLSIHYFKRAQIFDHRNVYICLFVCLFVFNYEDKFQWNIPCLGCRE